MLQKMWAEMSTYFNIKKDGTIYLPFSKIYCKLTTITSAPLKILWSVPSKVNVTIWPSNFTPSYISKRIENICSQKFIHKYS